MAPIPDVDIDPATLDASDARHPDWEGYSAEELKAAEKAAPIPDGGAEHDRLVEPAE